MLSLFLADIHSKTQTRTCCPHLIWTVWQLCFGVVLCLPIWFGAWQVPTARKKYRQKETNKKPALPLLNFAIEHLHSDSKRKKKEKKNHPKVIYFSAAKEHFVTAGRTFPKLLLPDLCTHCKNLPVPRVIVTFYACTVQMLHTKKEMIFLKTNTNFI